MNRPAIFCHISGWLLALLLLAAPLQGQSQAPTEQILTQSRQTLKRILFDNILPFWYPATLDSSHGGYRLNHDLQGHWQGPADKTLLTQARLVWFYARLYNSGLGDQRHLEAARHGYIFIRDHLWDPEHGGFYWAVDHTGAQATIPGKHLYGQAFGLYALAEYTRATNDTQAGQLADELFALLEEKAHDPEHGGYSEYFQPDWSLVPPDSTTFFTYNFSAPTTKLMNTHLHLMEAFTNYYRLDPKPLVKERLVELIGILSSKVVRQQGACTDAYARDWTPLQGRWYDLVYYGHDLENVWLLMEACRAAEIPLEPLLGLFHGLWDYTLEHGFDQIEGGVFNTGPLGQSAPEQGRGKIFWVQGESMLSALHMYRLTGQTRYFDYFTKILQWVVERQIDWRHGEWYEEIGADGLPKGVKAGEWKAAYHHGRATLESLLLLDQLATPD
ncbi:MAG: N-acylglucosamine 2-epimerase [Candidatus Latescibacteria bacterium]|nr:N-acylglucosamine 2-epimerase [Candidatus Latescibacterota bacterium]